MNTVVSSSTSILSEEKQAILLTAVGQIAPTWPLDQSIAVNPYWEMRSERFEKVAARLGALAKVHCLMPDDYFKRLYQQGEITEAALTAAAQEKNVNLTPQELIAFLDAKKSFTHWHNLSDLLDNYRDQHKMAWRDEIINQISQFCAAHYQEVSPILPHSNQSSGNGHATRPDLYQHWLQVTRMDRGISIIMDEEGLHKHFHELPETYEALIAEAVETLGLDDNLLKHYSHALLLEVNGWASWAAYLHWQGNLYDQPHDDRVALLAVRLAWELVIWRYLKAQQTNTFSQLTALWEDEKARLPDLFEHYEAQQLPKWVWSKATEITYQQRLHKQIQRHQEQALLAPKLQAVFCIDVRSEHMRRALESQSDAIQTMGFAGFFGLPLEYQASGSPLSRPQLPGLLKPVIRVTEVNNAQSTQGFNQAARWQAWSSSSASTFSMVETSGWLSLFQLVKKSFFPEDAKHPIQPLADQEWKLTQNGVEVSIKDKIGLAAAILHAMGLKDYFAETVLLAGHASHTTNNLHAAGLDCGACGGQSGEVNVKVLAQLLNQEEVRQGLAEHGIVIPETTQFVAAIHNTTTDHLHYFDPNLNETVQQWLAGATTFAQRERIALIDETLVDASDKEIDQALIQRSQDWSQIRPEWGLANNAAFIVAPRRMTRQINLQGRSFLHEYQWQKDDGFKVLETIITAPMIVTNWINMQYNASVTDNLKYGSGNKVLHNAVGGNIGVFEGNGGDLRIGLSYQSLHNGTQWMHQPQRLSVYVASPREPLESIVSQHDNVRFLVDNEWLYLFRLSDDKSIERYYQGEWLPQIG